MIYSAKFCLNKDNRIKWLYFAGFIFLGISVILGLTLGSTKLTFFEIKQAFTDGFSSSAGARIFAYVRLPRTAAALICGAALFAAANLQQLAINMGASAGKAGFVTALYIVLVPVGQIFFKHTLPSRHWIAVAVAVTGMYFLCITDGFSISSTDLILLMCAFLFTIQILSVDRFSFRVDGLVLSCGMFLVVSVLSALVALPFEEISVSAVRSCIWPLLYISVFSSCLGYTFQILAQKGGNPAVVSLLLSLEAFFGAVFGTLLLGQLMTGRELLGCGLMIAATLIAELPMPVNKK